MLEKNHTNVLCVMTSFSAMKSSSSMSLLTVAMIKLLISSPSLTLTRWTHDAIISLLLRRFDVIITLLLRHLSARKGSRRTGRKPLERAAVVAVSSGANYLITWYWFMMESNSCYVHSTILFYVYVLCVNKLKHWKLDILTALKETALTKTRRDCGC